MGLSQVGALIRLYIKLNKQDNINFKDYFYSMLSAHDVYIIAIYNKVLDNKEFWDSLSQEDRKIIIDRKSSDEQTAIKYALYTLYDLEKA